MTLTEKINQDYLAAYKNRETEKVNVLRLLKSALQNEAIQTGSALDDTQAQAVLNREAKKRREAIEQYQAAGREESAVNEQGELAIIASYLPQSLSDADLEEVITAVLTETGATQKSDMGKVMGVLKQKLSNPADISRAAQSLSQKLQ